MRSRAERSLAAGIAALGVLMLAGAFRIDPGVGYDRIGPRFFPFVVAMGLVVLGGWYAVSQWWNKGLMPERTPERDHSHTQLNWVAFGLLGLSLAFCVTLFDRVGFVGVASIQFWLVTRAFESRRPVRDGAIAVVVATAVYLAFSRGLGLALP